MRLWQAMLVAGVPWVGGTLHTVGAEEPATPPPAEKSALGAPATDAAGASDSVNAKVDALIRQLGAEKLADREAAVTALREIGEAAVPALTKALECGDAEIASRADVLIRHFRRPPQAARLPAGVRLFNDPGAAAGVRVHMAVNNDKRRVEVNEPGRTIRIDEGPDGIQMAVTGQLDGREVTRHFAARTPDELRKQNPEAFSLYDRFAGRAAGGLLPQGRLIVPPPGVGGAGRALVRIVPGPDDGPVEFDDELGALDELIEQQMRDAQIPEARRREVQGVLQRLRDARARRDPLAADPARVHEQMDAFNREADALRDRMRDLELPDPGDALPPPPDARLGIEVLEDPDEGVTVLHVIPGARAARLGLEPLDVITRVNGQPVGDARELRRAVTEAKPPLVLEGTRDGEPLKLEEKVEEGKVDRAAPDVEKTEVEEQSR